MISRLNRSRAHLAIAFLITAHPFGIITIVGCSGGGEDPGGADCPACTVDWVPAGVSCGFGETNIECEHGMENDQDCYDAAEPWLQANYDTLKSQGKSDAEIESLLWVAICSELNGGQGECSCFECGLATGCEGYIEVYKAWCGLGKGDPDSCQIGSTTVATEVSVRKQWTAAIPNGTECSFNQGFKFSTFCGLPESYGSACSCLGDNGCVKDPSSKQEIKSKNVPKCLEPSGA